ncbi:unnamed protein product, partial [Penicillium discolor]
TMTTGAARQQRPNGTLHHRFSARGCRGAPNTKRARKPAPSRIDLLRRFGSSRALIRARYPSKRTKGIRFTNTTTVQAIARSSSVSRAADDGRARAASIATAATVAWTAGPARAIATRCRRSGSRQPSVTSTKKAGARYRSMNPARRGRPPSRVRVSPCAVSWTRVASPSATTTSAKPASGTGRASTAPSSPRCRAAPTVPAATTAATSARTARRGTGTTRRSSRAKSADARRVANCTVNGGRYVTRPGSRDAPPSRSPLSRKRSISRSTLSSVSPAAKRARSAETAVRPSIAVSRSTTGRDSRADGTPWTVASHPEPSAVGSNATPAARVGHESAVRASRPRPRRRRTARGSAV